MKPIAAATPLRIAVFSAGGLAGAPSEEALQRLRDTRADVFVVLGGLGRTSAQAAPSQRALGSLGRLTLLIRDGADNFELAEEQAPKNADLLLDASALRSIELGQDRFLPWPGADQGRYALASGAKAGCGFGADELKRWISELGEKLPGERRWLLSWQAPEPGTAFAEQVVRARIDGVLSAWPPQRVVPDEPWNPAEPLLVPRAWGPGLEGPEGPLLPQGAVVLQLESSGPRVVR